jgi:hypothetical protein
MVLIGEFQKMDPIEAIENSSGKNSGASSGSK